MTHDRNSLLLGLAIGLSIGVSLRAQSAAVTLTLGDGTRSTPIARFANGQWVSVGSCVPAAGPASVVSARERLRAIGGGQIHEPRRVGPGTPEWLRLAPTIMTLFEQREREQRLTVDRTAGAPRAVDWIYGAEGEGGRTYYFEASRRVANAYVDVDADTDPPGTLRVVVAGFLQDERDRLTSPGTKSELRWEQDGLPAGPSRPDLTPLGVFPQGGRTTWVMKGQSGTSTWFTLYDVGAGRVRSALTTRVVPC